MNITCTTCNASNPDGAAFCEECGVELTAEATAAAPAPETPPPPQPASGFLDDEPLGEPLAEPDSDASAPGTVPIDPGISTPAPAPVVAEPWDGASDAPLRERPFDRLPDDKVVAEPWDGASDASAPAPAVPQGVQSAQLVLVEFGSVTDTAIPLQNSPVIVGKFDPSQGPVDLDMSRFAGSEYLSRQHAELYFDDGWMVRDLGSTNGVFIRKRGQAQFQPRLQSPAPLENEDVIAFGNVHFIFRTTA